MKKIIEELDKQKDKLYLLHGVRQSEHGSVEQVRNMIEASIIEQAIGNLEITIKQLQILDRELY